MKKLIVIDADIEFKSSPELLYKQFQNFKPSQVQIIAIYINKVAFCVFVRNIFLYNCHEYPSLSSNFYHQGENNQV